MSALTTQLEQLKIQQEELEKRIQEEAETKKKLNNEASIERLEALVEPITEILNYIEHGTSADSYRYQNIQHHEKEMTVYNSEIIRRPDRTHRVPQKNMILSNEEINITLIGILKKQDERIKILESK